MARKDKSMSRIPRLVMLLFIVSLPAAAEAKP
jgi:hypothetical protein